MQSRMIFLHKFYILFSGDSPGCYAGLNESKSTIIQFKVVAQKSD